MTGSRWVAAVVTAGLLVGLPAGRAAADAAVERVGGADRSATASAVSGSLLPTCPASGCPAVVLANSDDPVDALAGAPLAADLGAPLLLTDSDGLDAVTEREIRRLGAGTAVLLGGTDALSPQVEDDLGAVGVRRVERVAGADRYATAAAVAQHLAPEDVIVARSGPGEASADAAGAWTLAAADAGAVLLVAGDGVPAATRDALRQLDVERITVVGGEAAAPVAVADQLAVTVDPILRLGGATRYETGALVARRSAEVGADAGAVFVADGRSSSDAVVAGAAAATQGGVLLLVDGGDTSASPAFLEHMEDHRGILREVVLVGGSEVVRDETVERVRDVVDTTGRPFEFFSIEVAVEPGGYGPGDAVAYEITTCNNQDRPYQLVAFDPLLTVEVLDHDGMVVADNIVGVNFTDGTRQVVDGPRECKTGTSTWGQQSGPLRPENSQSEPGPRAEPGAHRIRVQLNAGEGNPPWVGYPPVYSDAFVLE